MKVKKFSISIQGGRRHWIVNYAVIQSLLTPLSYSLAKQSLGFFNDFLFVGFNMVVRQIFNIEFKTKKETILFIIINSDKIII